MIGSIKEQPLYLNLQQRPPIGRRLRKTTIKAVTRSGMPVGLSANLIQSLHKNLYSSLHPDACPAQPIYSGYPTASISINDLVSPDGSLFGSFRTGAFVRQVSLLSGESISYTFSSEAGLTSEALPEGRMLVLTNFRVMTFGQKNGVRGTILVPLEEVKVVAVNAGRRSKGALLQGGLMIVAAVFMYVLLAYWMTGRIDGPTVPIIRMDLVAFVVFLAILTGVTMLAQMYFAKPDGEVLFQGDGVEVKFAFRGKTAEEDIYVLVNAVFAARQAVAGGAELSVD